MKNLLLTAATAVALCTSIGATAQTPGVLLVNEFSKGAGNSGPYIELLVGSTTSATSVDVRNWIVDDNNEVFGASGISTGHLRFTDTSYWANVPAGTLILLFDNANSPSTAGLPHLTEINLAKANGSYDGIPGIIFVAVGKSRLVSYKNNLPTNSAPVNHGYCGGNAYQAPGVFSVTALATDLTGDGIQTRCPGCLTNLQQEPSFYSGAAYGSAMSAVTGGINGALIATSPSYTTFSGKVFKLTSGTSMDAPGVSTNWTADTATVATQTPGDQNSPANGTFIANVAGAGASFRYTACAQPQPMTEPKGALVVTEISNGPSGTCEYVVLAVAPCSASNNADSVDVRGWILDDNNGIFNPSGTGTGKGITTGHFRLAFNEQWRKVPVGSSIVLYNGADNCINLPSGLGSIDGHAVYFEGVATPGTNTNIERYNSFPTSAVGDYCNPNGTNTPYATATSYDATVGLSNSGDGFQVRCPGCNDMNNVAPVFYHGLGYGTASGAAAFATATGLIGGPVFNFTNGANHRLFLKAAVSITSSTDLALPANFDTAVALTSAATVGSYASGLFDYITGGGGDFPCCGSSVPKSAKQTVGLNNSNLNNAVKAYPNPAKGVLNIEFPASDNVSVKLIDVNGRVVAEQNANGKNKVTINTANVAPGLYFYQVTANGTVQSGKVTIAK